jgi:hypothetical protein
VDNLSTFFAKYAVKIEVFGIEVTTDLAGPVVPDARST